ncbi:hypothetical protein DFP72DRAFT_1059831 [Ephemerocybe angulata]|uniref:Uncharacterized protein n=1 Tax=Ephemerocybe angulata TaxID=980116 RepID=A0A8H6IE27_9AGAR|nr:hypothetical protein DFP72DRAFT_1059831 [Tulosesus angulatus]
MLIAGFAAVNSGVTAAGFFGLREFVVSPVLTYTAPWPQYARRREELGVTKFGSEAASTPSPSSSGDAAVTVDTLRTNKLLDSGISGAATGGLVRGIRSGRAAILPGAAMAGVACVALQYAYNRATMARLRLLAAPQPEVAGEPQPSFRERMFSIFGVSQISEEEYIDKLKKTRDLYLKRISDLERMHAYEDAKAAARRGESPKKDDLEGKGGEN